jgi:hypothetical protein
MWMAQTNCILLKLIKGNDLHSCNPEAMHQEHAVLNHHLPQEGPANGVREENSPSPLYNHFASSVAHPSGNLVL